jgi:hypothetical protein
MSRYHTNHTTKIARLADQAHEQSNTIYNERLKIERADEVIFYDIFNQRFAELIVRECVGACLYDDWEDPRWVRFYANKIQEHFGVES